MSTIKAGAYWNHKGRYQKKYEKLWDELVPAYGDADTWMGNLLIAISRIYYDRYNNGFGNGPHWEEVELLKEHEQCIKKHMKNPELFDEFIQRFKWTNYGEETVGRNWRGDKPLEAVTDGVIMCVWNSYKKQKQKK